MSFRRRLTRWKNPRCDFREFPSVIVIRGGPAGQWTDARRCGARLHRGGRGRSTVRGRRQRMRTLREHFKLREGCVWCGSRTTNGGRRKLCQMADHKVSRSWAGQYFLDWCQKSYPLTRQPVDYWPIRRSAASLIRRKRSGLANPSAGKTPALI